GLYRLRPALSNETVVRRETVSSMQRRLSRQATSVGVNGDFFTLADGRPSGITLRDGVLLTPPNAARSSLGVGLDGLLDIRRVSFRATWRGLGQRRAVNFLNRAPGANGVSLFTTDWGRITPAVAGSYAVVLSDFPVAAPGADIVSPVTAVYQNARVGIAPGTAVLVARGNAAARLREEVPVGVNVTVRLILQPDWAAVSDAIGGGPLLVRNGAPVFRANEAFTTSQLAPRGPRSAVGQRADGSVLLVTTDGRQPGYSVGMTNFELALTLVRFGAVRGMALDGGGSSTLAFEGTVLNRPSGGSERAVSNALMLQYFGAYVAPPAEPVVSPNGDGVAEEQRLAFKIVRPSSVTVTLTGPNGGAAFQETDLREPGAYEVPFPPPPPQPPNGEPPASAAPAQPQPPAEGRWTLNVSAVDDQGLSSSAVRRFSVNSTLGFLRLDPVRLVLRPTGASGTIRWTQARTAQVRVTVETMDGILVRTVAQRRFEPGEHAVIWNGMQRNGKPAAGGRYLVRVAATNGLGSVALERPLVVRRVAGPKK
ncbi:MAG TPA: phosphodiester glycosidase family protein, partial [Gaiellaceae bacterium]|nr:phosphodiester glycosidase family protein [Gaiellaceae bacterium]